MVMALYHYDKSEPSDKEDDCHVDDIVIRKMNVMSMT
jgi:hypothetical protein